jgi:hypothetical protein
MDHGAVSSPELHPDFEASGSLLSALEQLRGESLWQHEKGA